MNTSEEKGISENHFTAIYTFFATFVVGLSSRLFVGENELTIGESFAGELVGGLVYAIVAYLLVKTSWFTRWPTIVGLCFGIVVAAFIF